MNTIDLSATLPNLASLVDRLRSVDSDSSDDLTLSRSRRWSCSSQDTLLSSCTTLESTITSTSTFTAAAAAAANKLQPVNKWEKSGRSSSWRGPALAGSELSLNSSTEPGNHRPSFSSSTASLERCHLMMGSDSPIQGSAGGYFKRPPSPQHQQNVSNSSSSCTLSLDLAVGADEHAARAKDGGVLPLFAHHLNHHGGSAPNLSSPPYGHIKADATRDGK